MLSDKGVIMEVIMNGVYNFLSFIDKNWTMICAIVVLAMAITKKAVAFFSKSREEQVEIAKAQIEEQVKIAKAQINEVMLKLVTRAEISYAEWIKSGAIKRAEVIDEIFNMYPILSKVSNQTEIIAWIDDTIDKALETMREIFEENKAAAVAKK